MKKLLFASALCATAAAFAADTSGNTFNPANYTGFDGFVQDASNPKQIGGNNDTGDASGSIFFAYEADNGSTDASQVKEYSVEFPAFGIPTCGVPDFFQEDSTNTKYLDLSTEGGTLWRSVLPISSNFGSDTLTLTTDVYFDTMVQFTPTEDGETPQLGEEDKMAIWLNVDETTGKTNLCVRAAQFNQSSTLVAPTTFTVTNATVEANVWYRLTVKMLQSVDFTTTVSGFMIYLDGEKLKTDVQGVVSGEAEIPLREELKADIEAGAVFCSLTGTDPASQTLTGVGFKGSGKLDDLAITDDVPDFLIGGGSSIDFTLTWGEGVSAVSYTLSSDLTVTNALTSGTAVQLAPGDGTATIELIPTFDTGYEFDKVTMGETDLGLTFAIPGVTTNATLFAKSAAAAYPTYINTSDATITAKYDAWKAGVGCDDSTASSHLNQFLLNVDEETTVGDAALTITEIKENATAGWDITIGCTVSGASLTGTVGQTIVCNGYLAVSYTDDLTGTWTTENIAVTAVDATAGTVTVNVNKAGAKFMKVSLTAAPAAAPAPAGE